MRPKRILEKPFDERRLEALLKAKIDRSLPTVLKAWSTKAESEDDQKEKVAQKKDPAATATVVNIYEDFVVLDFEKTPAYKKDEAFEVHADDKLVGVVTVLSVKENKVSGNFSVEVKQADEEKSKEQADPKNENKADAEKKADDAKEPESEPATKDAAEAKDEVAAPAWHSLKTDVAVKILKPDDGSRKKAEEESQIKEQVAQWTKMVTLGKWSAVQAFIRPRSRRKWRIAKR